MFIGIAIAIKPASQLTVAVSKLLTVVPEDVVMPAKWLPQVEGIAVSGSLLQTAIYGIAFLGIGLLGARMLTE